MTHTSELSSAIMQLKQLTGIELNIDSFSDADSDVIAEQLQRLCTAYREKYDRTYFFRNLLKGVFSLDEINELAAKFHFKAAQCYQPFLIETSSDSEEMITSILKQMFPASTGAFLFSVSEKQFLLLSPFSSKVPDEEALLQIADSISDTLSAEALIMVHIACAPPVFHLSELSASYESALFTLKVGRTFHAEQNVFLYNHLSTGRLIYHLPESVCLDFLKEIFRNQIPKQLEPEMLTTINRFLQNNMNIAETARQLHMHRNTLIYRIEQIEKQTGLDIRKFEDAMTYKTALMVMNYINTK